MATGLQYRETLNIISGGYAGEGVGSNGVAQNWTDAEQLSGVSVVKYWYHDSAQQSDANSTLVEIEVADSWSATIDSRNVITITVSSTLNSIVRTVQGSPSAAQMSMFVRREAGATPLWSATCVDAAINYSYLPNPIDLGSHTFTLQPGDATQFRSSIYYRNNTCGYDSEPTPSMYVDEFGIGISFRNTLPADYRPGKTYNASTGKWLSHNRSSGAADIRNAANNGWTTMRTIGGNGSNTGNPPYIRSTSAWVNQREIGEE